VPTDISVVTGGILSEVGNKLNNWHYLSSGKLTRNSLDTGEIGRGDLVINNCICYVLFYRDVTEISAYFAAAKTRLPI
jgi:hypothetical protein